MSPSAPPGRRAADSAPGPAAPAPVSEGGSPRVQKPRRAAPEGAVRPTRAEVNLAHLRHNLRALERSLGAGLAPSPSASASGSIGAAIPAKIWGVLKADGYGHGAPAAARTLERAGIAGICVALLEEAIELRDAGIHVPILVMGGYYGSRLDGLEEILENDLLPVVYDAGQIERIASFARAEGHARVNVHLKVDTGMGRLGASPADLDTVFEALASHPEVRLDGLMTHFACADADDLGTTRAQLHAFRAIEKHAARHGLAPRVRHAANSAAMLRLPEARFDLVRPGIALFGVSPLDAAASEAAGFPELRPVMRVRTEIVAMRSIPKGQRIGYGHTWQADRASVIATVPIGYADGLSRLLSNRGHMLARGRRAPIAGTVSMDMTMIDVTDIPGAKLGDEVVVLGAQEGPLGKDVIGAEEIAAHTGSIPWEVLTSISRRVPRFYREP